jgi:YgiT-type zinc finger domain-containing protein
MAPIHAQCHVCGANMQERIVSQDFWIKGKLIVVEKVPAGVCVQCGERVVNAETGKRIAALLKDSQRLSAAPTIRVPLVQYTPQSR